MIELKGIAAASGYAVGRAYLVQEAAAEVVRRSLSADDVQQEVSRFADTTGLAVQELESLRLQTLGNLGEEQAEIFATHISIILDDEFAGEISEKIKTEAINAEAALADVTNELIAVFESMDDEYMRARAADFRDISQRVMHHLIGRSRRPIVKGQDRVILFCDDLSPSDTAQLDRGATLGFATRFGGRTAHSAIMARSMGIPAVVGLQNELDQVQMNDIVILDGDQGIVYVNPTKEKLLEYEVKQRESAHKINEYMKFADKPSVTADHVRVELAANIGNIDDAYVALHSGAEGIGLYRTEFLYMGRSSLPTEEEQFLSYKAVTEIFGPSRPVVIRTLDVGGDKELPYLDLPKEMNPFLGYRAIRLCLDQVDLFKTQLRAILRASHYGNIKIMFPMIATLQELRQAKAVLAEVCGELEQQGIPYNRAIEVGIMIEVPAAALIADQLAKEADFFSIGTNDLVQYTMAADRMNDKVSYLTQPFHPAVLRLIDRVIKEAHAQGKWVGMCGEMAGQTAAIPILLGMGLDEFSMSASSILPARALISKLTQSEMKSLAEEVLTLESAEEIERHVMDVLSSSSLKT